MEPEVETYVAIKMVERWLADGYTVSDIPLLWNQGHAGKCSSGVNKLGVAFNSCAYRQAVLARI